MTAADPRIGTEIAGYRIEELLGRGGMSVVYLAQHARLQRKVAFKVLAPELAEDERFAQRFVRESLLAASLDHPNVIPIYDAGEADGVLFIAMRYVQSTDLRALVRRSGRLQPDRTIEILDQVASALDAAHARGLVHRDVKPGNILIASGAGPRGKDHAYLSDFGLTKHILTTSGPTSTGQFVGTLAYAAPEQIRGEPLDGRADIYALGCVLFECLTGRPPFSVEDIAVVAAHLFDPPPRISPLNPVLPFELDEVIETALAKRREERYPTCEALIAAAARALSAGGIAVTTEQPGPVEASTVGGEVGLTQPRRKRPTAGRGDVGRFRPPPRPDSTPTPSLAVTEAPDGAKRSGEGVEHLAPTAGGWSKRARPPILTSAIGVAAAVVLLALPIVSLLIGTTHRNDRAPSPVAGPAVPTVVERLGPYAKSIFSGLRIREAFVRSQGGAVHLTLETYDDMTLGSSQDAVTWYFNTSDPLNRCKLASGVANLFVYVSSPQRALVYKYGNSCSAPSSLGQATVVEARPTTLTLLMPSRVLPQHFTWWVHTAHPGRIPFDTSLARFPPKTPQGPPTQSSPPEPRIEPETIVDEGGRDAPFSTVDVRDATVKVLGSNLQLTFAIYGDHPATSAVAGWQFDLDGNKATGCTTYGWEAEVVMTANQTKLFRYQRGCHTVMQRAFDAKIQGAGGLVVIPLTRLPPPFVWQLTTYDSSGFETDYVPSESVTETFPMPSGG